jgi:predicted dehydrogenase
VTTGSPIRVGIIGAGLMTRAHLQTMLPREDTQVVALCEPSAAALTDTAATFARHHVPLPPNEPDWRRFLDRYGGALDVVLIVTPHVYHYEQAAMALRTGLDVLLEKPMVMTAAEATALIEERDRSGRLLVVAFPGSLSPRIRVAARMIASGEIGRLLSIEALVWQDWQAISAGTWRQDPAMSGGGFLFDTGAHMLNTVADLAGEDLAEVAGWLEDDGSPVDVRATVMARLASGALITMHGCGRSVQSWGSDVRVFCERATLRTGVWGERLTIQRAGSARAATVRSAPGRYVWDQFVAVRAGLEPNPSPPETGLRLARLWDAIQASSAAGGAVVRPAVGS